MKLAMQYLEQIDNISTPGIISFVFFFSFFLAVLFHVLRTKTSYYDTVNNFPLDDGDLKSSNNQNNKINL